MKKPVLIIIVSFLTAILSGALLLMIPAATVNGSLSFSDAVFTSASAITVTGLIVVDTATVFTTFGQCIIMFLLQFGGLGFMTFSTLIILLIGKSISLTDKIIIENDFTSGNYRSIRQVIKKVFLLTLMCELVGAALLYFQFTNLEGGGRIFASVFHSISAFCNAGFSIFSNSLEDYTTNPGINFTVSFLIILGGLGFLVMNELWLLATRDIKSIKKLSLHTKMVVIISGVLIVAGFIFIFVKEVTDPSNTHSVSSNALIAFFQSVSARTAGFNTVNLNMLSGASIFIIIILMFIGSSPGSTGGGVKTTSVGMVLAYFKAKLTGKDKVNIFYRNVPSKTVEKAFLVIILSFLLVSIAFWLLLFFEESLSPMALLFETFSAFGTVGLSLGITSKLTAASKVVMIIAMFIGRVGPLTILIAMSKRESAAVLHYPEENIMIG